MPNRILHESIKYCPKMEQLNWFEEVVYHRLTVTVDDYGCLDGRIVLLKNTLFPTREDISKDDIARAIEHMVALGLLRAYEAGGMPYLCFPAWEEEQRVRNKRRKFPAPPDEEEPLAAEDSLSAADGGALFAGEKHLTASCCQLTAGCPPESNPYPNPYPNPDSNPKFESGSVTNPYPIQAPSACAEERPRAGEQSLRHSLRCDTVPQFSMVVPLRSQARLWHSLLHWAYYGLFPPLAAAFVRPFSLREKGGFWTAQLPAIVPLPKRLPCVRGTKEAAQPVAAIAVDEPSEAGSISSELCERREATMLN